MNLKREAKRTKKLEEKAEQAKILYKMIEKQNAAKEELKKLEELKKKGKKPFIDKEALKKLLKWLPKKKEADKYPYEPYI